MKRIPAPVLASLWLFGCMQAFADEPVPAPAPATTQAAKAAADTAAAGKTVASDANATAAAKVTAAKPAADTAATDADANGGATDAEIKKFRNMGYKPVVKNGTAYYCRDETQLGSRFPQRVCRTAKDMVQAARDGQDAANAIQQQGLANRPRN
jgi:hypothetical protein